MRRHAPDLGLPAGLRLAFIDGRFFARYHADEAEALLDRAGFTIDLRHHSASGGPQWLRFLALRRQ